MTSLISGYIVLVICLTALFMVGGVNKEIKEVVGMMGYKGLLAFLSIVLVASFSLYAVLLFLLSV